MILIINFLMVVFLAINKKSIKGTFLNTSFLYTLYIIDILIDSLKLIH